MATIGFAAVAARVRKRRLSPALVPASFFGIVLGLGGLANTWRAAHASWPVPSWVGEGIFILATLAWVVIGSLYALKWVFHTKAAMNEAHHPVQCCFIGLSGVATLVIAQGSLPYSRKAALMLFLIGAGITLGFGVWRTGRLWQGGRDPEATTSVLYLPIVAGGFVTAATASALGMSDWAGFAWGAAFFSWMAIESVLLHRLYTAAPMPPELRPTLGIQLAPPTVGALAYMAIAGPEGTMVVNIMLGYALLQGLLLLRLSRWIGEQRFVPSYWAFSFGVTALATALIRIPTMATSEGLMFLAHFAFLGANLFVTMLVTNTIRLAWRPGTSAQGS